MTKFSAGRERVWAGIEKGWIVCVCNDVARFSSRKESTVTLEVLLRLTPPLPVSLLLSRKNERRNKLYIKQFWGKLPRAGLSVAVVFLLSPLLSRQLRAQLQNKIEKNK